MPRAFLRIVRTIAFGGLTTAAACRGGRRVTADSGGDVGLVDRMRSALGLGSDTLADVRGIPRYTDRPFTQDERQLLRAAFGIEDPSKLYLADSTDGGRLKYDTKVKRCPACYVNSYGVGFVSVRKLGETWEDAEERVHHLKRRDFPSTALVESISLDLLEPDVKPMFEKMLTDAKTAGFAVQVVATYRSPEREAFLMSLGGNRTHTLTSMHSYGRAIDVAISGGNIRRPKTRAAWIAFRQWLVDYDQHEFRILGQIEHTWDWRHIELRSDSIGFRSIDAAIEAARRCATTGATPADCTFQPRLPTMAAHEAVVARAGRARR
ncbi:MAG: hypothetical protein ABI442_18535 [Gemmatimonadaceae bacterium]